MPAARVEVGFIGGQVMSARLDADQLRALREAVESGGGWYDLGTEEGSVAVDVSKVVFLRVAGSQPSIGFKGE